MKIWKKNLKHPITEDRIKYFCYKFPKLVNIRIKQIHMKAKLVKLPPCAQIQEKKKTQENNATNRGYILPCVSGSLEMGKILCNIAVCNQGHKTKYILFCR